MRNIYFLPSLPLTAPCSTHDRPTQCQAQQKPSPPNTQICSLWILKIASLSQSPIYLRNLYNNSPSSTLDPTHFNRYISPKGSDTGCSLNLASTFFLFISGTTAVSSFAALPAIAPFARMRNAQQYRRRLTYHAQKDRKLGPR